MFREKILGVLHVPGAAKTLRLRHGFVRPASSLPPFCQRLDTVLLTSIEPSKAPEDYCPTWPTRLLVPRAELPGPDVFVPFKVRQENHRERHERLHVVFLTQLKRLAKVCSSCVELAGRFLQIAKATAKIVVVTTNNKSVMIDIFASRCRLE